MVSYTLSESDYLDIFEIWQLMDRVESHMDKIRREFKERITELRDAQYALAKIINRMDEQEKEQIGEIRIKMDDNWRKHYEKLAGIVRPNAFDRGAVEETDA